MPADWTDEDYCCPPKPVVSAALSFLAHARLAGVLSPAGATIDGDGEIAFRWTAGQSSASACFSPDGNIIGYVSRPGRKLFKLDTRYEEDLDLTEFFHKLRSFA